MLFLGLYRGFYILHWYLIVDLGYSDGNTWSGPASSQEWSRQCSMRTSSITSWRPTSRTELWAFPSDILYYTTTNTTIKLCDYPTSTATKHTIEASLQPTDHPPTTTSPYTPNTSGTWWTKSTSFQIKYTNYCVTSNAISAPSRRVYRGRN